MRGIRSKWSRRSPCSRTPSGEWSRGLGDVALAFKRTRPREHADGGRSAPPAWKSSCRPARSRLGSATATPSSSRSRCGVRCCRATRFCSCTAASSCRPTTSKGAREAFVRTAIGTTLAQDRGFGRAWSPQVEVLWARPEGGPSEWDVVPQIQVTLSKLQHVMVAGGVRDSAHPARRAADAGAGLSAVGLVRRRILRVLEMSRARVDHVRRGGRVAGRAAGDPARRAGPVARQRRPVPLAPRRRHADVSMFAPSSECLACHNNLVTPTGEDVSIGASWRGIDDGELGARSLRAGQRPPGDHRPSARAPRTSRTSARPATCRPRRRSRMPPAGRAESSRTWPARRTCRPRSRRLARDGVACTVCHQIAPDRLGTRESFNGNFVVAPPLANGRRRAFGPFAADAGRRRIMHSVTGFEQEQAAHIRESELCATCHTLDHRGARPGWPVIGSLPEQMNYQEWRHSAFFARAAQLPVVPHAAGGRARARRVGARRGPRRAWPGTRSSAATPSCSV